MAGRCANSFGLVSTQNAFLTYTNGREMRQRARKLTRHRDREWQKWPVTIVTGAYIGYAVGKLLGGTLLRGKKIMFA